MDGSLRPKGACLLGASEMERKKNGLRCFCVTEGMSCINGIIMCVGSSGINQWKTLKVILKMKQC